MHIIWLNLSKLQMYLLYHVSGWQMKHLVITLLGMKLKFIKLLDFIVNQMGTGKHSAYE
jgi:hypothetical protein